MGNLITKKTREMLEVTGLRTKMLRGGVKRLINVHAATLVDNIATGARAPMVMIRPARNRSRVLLVHHFQILKGDVLCCETYDDPLPGTKGRGVAYLQTDGWIQVWY